MTGASTGVGAAAVRELHVRGAIVVPVGRSGSRTEAIARELGVKGYTVDFSRFRNVCELADRLLHDFPGIDVLANNAGGIPTGHRHG
ncbi:MULTISPECIES: SDR family NAD(P)-dependent oxidoreductase [unclassified Paenibacillus]|uniref:SDR family NAD(P)-dependent oxidoreductase n=1 Tax=unclassified Paenibacillus TaxID=185978 RepID=UPI00363B6774